MKVEAWEEVGFTKATARKNDRCTVRFKACGLKATWPEKGRQKADQTRPMMSQSAGQRGKVEAM